ncbi:MAG: hypothetical protein WAT39_24485 [Planctomycetota bacterium]
MPGHCTRALLLAAAAGLPGTACTLAKPVVGTLVSPVVFVGDVVQRDWHWLGKVALALHALPFAVAIAPFTGLYHGVASDSAAIAGKTRDATRNWWHPMRSNLDSPGRIDRL